MSAYFCDYTETHGTTHFKRMNVMACELYLNIAVFRNKEKMRSSRIRLTSLWLNPTAWHGTWPLVGMLLRNLVTGDRNTTLTGSCGWKILEGAVFRCSWVQELKYLELSPSWSLGSDFLCVRLHPQPGSPHLPVQMAPSSCEFTPSQFRNSSKKSVSFLTIPAKILSSVLIGLGWVKCPSLNQ